MSPNICFVQASFDYRNPAATQQRTLALIRAGDKSGFYFDVFRSRAAAEDGSFHDYIYHNVGQSLALQDVSGAVFDLKTSSELAAAGLLPGHKYFKNERSLPWTNDLSGVFTLDMPDGSKREMRVWMPGAPDWTVYSLAAPANHAGRDSMRASINELLMPTLLVRQEGDAWLRPFVTIYEPFLQSDGLTEVKVRAAKITDNSLALAPAVVEVKDLQVCLMQDDQGAATHTVESNSF